MTHILALRLSALGDVAMTVPALRALAEQHAADRVTLVTRAGWEPLFDSMPANFDVCGVDLADYRGLRGLARLYSRLSKLNPDAVADLHDVLRTKYLRFRFRLAGKRVAHIDKGRCEKHRLVRRRKRLVRPLKHTVTRYADVLARLGFAVQLSAAPAYGAKPLLTDKMKRLLSPRKEGEQWIGIAPFAKHRGKIYPAQLMARVIAELAGAGRRVFLFGAGEAEARQCDEWAGQTEGVVSMVGRTSLRDELSLIAQLDVMLSMDSANMHLAALVGTPVVSVWGATHPNAGFAAWGQPADRQVGLQLQCRPCSIYGNRPCPRTDYACLTQLPVSAITSRVEQQLKDQNHDESENI